MAPKRPSFVNHYAVLGVSKNASAQAIQKAFWDLARRYHPDINPSPLATERYKQVVDAYQSLKSPARRNDLDTQILADSCQHLAGDIFRKRRRDEAMPDSFLRILMDLLLVKEVEETKKIYGMTFPECVRYRKLLFVGPPGVGKTLAVTHMRAWPEEGSLDLTQPEWWRGPVLAVRPRELHLLLPFPGHEEGMAVFDPPILQAGEGLTLNLSRIKSPPPARGFFSTDWQKRYVFDFLMPEPEKIITWRKARAQKLTHMGDDEITLEQIQKQCRYFEQAARYLHLTGAQVILRRGWDCPPLRYVLPEEDARIVLDASQTPGNPFATI